MAMRDELFGKYSEPHRAYHTLEHIAECLEVFAAMRALAADADLVEFAIWAHDIIYDTHRDDNERLSAEWARRALLDAGLPSARAAQAHALVIATAHVAPPADADSQLLVDVDLAILGASRKRFEEYERAIRREYSWVPEQVFRTRRTEILERFLQRPTIYTSAWCRERFESAARENIERSLRVLREDPPSL